MLSLRPRNYKKYTLMSALTKLKADIAKAIKKLTGQEVEPKTLTLSSTRKEFEGDYTLLVFPLARYFGKSPEEVGKLIGEELKASSTVVDDYNTIKGFLNLSFAPEYWTDTLTAINTTENFGKGAPKDKRVMVEFSSPNTNKPLHLGHIRNILLGWSVSKIMDAAGYEVITTQVVNDRGIAICKSMLAWEKWGDGITPENSGKKGDFLVGDFYVKFNTEFSKEYSDWQTSKEAEAVFKNQNEIQDKAKFFDEYKNNYFNEYSKLGSEARQMLLKWENKESETMELWKNMNSWVLNGFDQTYDKLGVHFTKSYFESDTYILGRSIVEEGLKKGVFYKEKDGSIWVDLTDANMDKKIVLRSDGTSLYITQDIGTAELRYKDFNTEKMIYVVGDEQEYHFKVLFEILKRLERPYASDMYHLSYGMVELPTGKMKSREGKVVDADDLINQMTLEARANAEEKGIIDGSSDKERNEIYRKIGMAALKFFILKVNPKRRMIFNPEESVDLQGQTGPYIQNAYVRIKSIMRKAEGTYDFNDISGYKDFNSHEKNLITTLSSYPNTIQQAAEEYEPSAIANYVYDLAKKYHKYYSEIRILGTEDKSARNFRLALSYSVAQILKSGMDLLGIEMPERM